MAFLRELRTRRYHKDETFVNPLKNFPRNDLSVQAIRPDVLPLGKPFLPLSLKVLNYFLDSLSHKFPTNFAT